MLRCSKDSPDCATAQEWQPESALLYVNTEYDMIRSLASATSPAGKSRSVSLGAISTVRMESAARRFAAPCIHTRHVDFNLDVFFTVINEAVAPYGFSLQQDTEFGPGRCG